MPCRRIVGRTESSGCRGVRRQAWQKRHVEKERERKLTIERDSNTGRGFDNSKPASTARGPKQQIKANLTHPKQSCFAKADLKLKGVNDALGFRQLMDLPGKAPNSKMPSLLFKMEIPLNSLPFNSLGSASRIWEFCLILLQTIKC